MGEFLSQEEAQETMDALCERAFKIWDNVLSKMILKKKHLAPPLVWVLAMTAGAMQMVKIAIAEEHTRAYFKFVVQVAARLWGPEEAIAAITAFEEDREASLKEWLSEVKPS